MRLSVTVSVSESCLLQPPQAHDVTATFVEVVGTAIDATTVKLLTCINMGAQLGGGLYLPHSDPNDIIININLPI